MLEGFADDGAGFGDGEAVEVESVRFVFGSGGKEGFIRCTKEME